MKHVLVFGRQGQIASALYESGQESGIKITRLGRPECDLLEDPKAARTAILSAHNIDAVINAAAYTDVDGAETNHEAATRLNAEAPAIMAEACVERRVPFIHISTDYVFAGDSGKPYGPDTLIDPLNAYGRSKADGEQAVLSANPDSTIIRTSWVYDSNRKNFLTTMLKLASTRDSVSVVSDQIGRPTYAPHFADALLKAAELISDKPNTAGVYHLTGEGHPVSWHGFAAAIFKKLELKPSLHAIASTDYNTPAHRPAYSVLDTSKFTETFGISMPPWETSLSAAITAVRNKA